MRVLENELGLSHESDMKELLIKKGIEIKKITNLLKDLEGFVSYRVIKDSNGSYIINNNQSLKVDLSELFYNKVVFFNGKMLLKYEDIDKNLGSGIISLSNIRENLRLSEVLCDRLYYLNPPILRGDIQGVFGLKLYLNDLIYPSFQIKQHEDGNFVKQESNIKGVRGFHLYKFSPKTINQDIFFKWRLFSFGIRSIHPVIDLVNFVSYYYGLPMHVFDYEKILFPLSIDTAQTGEIFYSLKGDVKLRGGEIIVRDRNNEIISLMGLQIAKNVGVSKDTKLFLLSITDLHPNLAYHVFFEKEDIYSSSAYFLVGGVFYPAIPSALEFIEKNISSKLFPLYVKHITESIKIEIDKNRPIKKKEMEKRGFVFDENAVYIPHYREDIISSKDLRMCEEQDFLTQEENNVDIPSWNFTGDLLNFTRFKRIFRRKMSDVCRYNEIYSLHILSEDKKNEDGLIFASSYRGFSLYPFSLVPSIEIHTDWNSVENGAFEIGKVWNIYSHKEETIASFVDDRLSFINNPEEFFVASKLFYILKIISGIFFWKLVIDKKGHFLFSKNNILFLKLYKEKDRWSGDVYLENLYKFYEEINKSHFIDDNRYSYSFVLECFLKYMSLGELLRTFVLFIKGVDWYYYILNFKDKQAKIKIYFFSKKSIKRRFIQEFIDRFKLVVNNKVSIKEVENGR